MLAVERVVEMPETQRNEPYLALKESVIVSAMQKLTDLQLKLIVEKYVSVINSRRRSSFIRTLADLIAVLEKRCYLSKDKVDFFIALANMLNDSNVYEMIARCRNVTVCNSSNTTVSSSSSRNSYCSSESSYQTRPQQRPQVALSPEVMKLVCRDIGTDWKVLVRELDAREGDIDAIETKYPRDLRQQILEGMKLFEQEYPPERQRKALMKALDAIGRRDIRELVEECLLSDINKFV